MKSRIIFFISFGFFSLCQAQSNLQFTSSCENVSECVGEFCSLSLNISVEATTDCNQGPFLIYNYSIDLFSDGFIDLVGTGNQFEFTDEIGNHTILFQVTDQCGSMISCENNIEIKDCTAPSLFCWGNELISFPLDDTLITIFASEVNIQVLSDNCDSNEDLIYSFSDSIYQPTITISCSDYFQSFTYLQEIFVWDKSGNQSSCLISFFLPDEIGSCNLQLFDTIPVCVTTTDLIPLDNFQVNNIDLIDDPDSDCKLYIPEVGFTAITLSRNTNPLNGITLLDLILMRKHILYIQPLEDPYKLAAGDINNSGGISAFDIVLLTRAILRFELSIPSSWYFIEPDFNLNWISLGVALPTSFPASEIDSAEFPLEFIALKVGDLDCSVDVTEQTNGFLQPPVDAFTFCTADKMLEAGEEVLIPIRAKDFNDVVGFTWTTKFDSEQLSFSGIHSNELYMGLWNLNTENSSSGILGGFWLDESYIGLIFSEEDTLFSLSFEVNENVLLSEVFSLDGSFVDMDAYNINDERLEVNFEFCNTVSIQDDFQKVLNLAVFPNPFHEKAEVRFYLLEGEVVTFSIFDISGRKIKSFTENLQSGQNSFFIEKKDFPSDGIYFYEVKTTENIRVGKLVLN